MNALASAWTIRPAALADAATLAGFNCAMARETENRELEPAVVMRGVATLLAHPEKGRYFVACDATGRIVGQMMHTFEWSDWRNGDYWWIQSVYVTPEFRGQGVYRALHDHIRALAVSAKSSVGLRLYVETDNDRAIGAYRKVGMSEAGYFVMEELFGAPSK